MPKAKVQLSFEDRFIAFLHSAPIEQARSTLKLGAAILAHRESADLIAAEEAPFTPTPVAAKKVNGAAKPAPAKTAGKRGRPPGSANKPKQQSRVSVTGPDENEAWDDAPFQRNEEALAEHAGD